ncbi:fimbrial protein [Hafnia paralvei]|uniref:fimbrial protein n=1 Tax=Hafnia paralvei TaxID=546367 RepID=UPI0026DB773E|nr:fimbrial protein [Hafnia paralvei]MDX6910593.1 fimbrial protein [Hafnia paralvei]
MKLQLFVTGILLAACCAAGSVHADGPLPPGVNLTATSGGTPVQITGNILPAPVCKINNNQASPQVDFGSDVRTDLINGVSYRAKEVPVTVTCDRKPGGAIQFSLTGTASSFDSAALQTNVTGLGIKIYNGGKAMDINSWGDINYNEPLNLTAVPVKLAGVNLQGGDFSASGTLVMRLE